MTCVGTLRPRFWGLMSTWIKRPGLRDGVIGRRDLAVTDADGQHEVNVLEGRLGGPRSLLAITPADGQRMGVGDAPLAADRRGHRRLEQLGDGGQRRPGVDASQPGIDSDPSPTVASDAPGPGRRRPRRTARGRGAVPAGRSPRPRAKRGTGSRRPTGPGSPGRGDPERLEDRAGDLRLVADLDQPP